MSKSSTTRTHKSGPTPDSGTGPWRGITTLDEMPIPSGEQGLALYNELWSKIRWAIGTAFSIPYGKTTHPLGELSRRFALLTLANMVPNSGGRPDFQGRKKKGAA